jgi:hypothetical protein
LIKLFKPNWYKYDKPLSYFCNVGCNHKYGHSSIGLFANAHISNIRETLEYKSPWENIKIDRGTIK